MNYNTTIIGIPKIYRFVSEWGYNFMIMELLGRSIEDLFADNRRLFS